MWGKGKRERWGLKAVCSQELDAIKSYVLENSEESIKNLLELIKELARFQGTRSIYKKNQSYFCMFIMNNPKMKLRKLFHSP